MEELEWSQNLIKEGCVWQVGCGNKINTWTDSWLAEERNRKIISLKPPDCNLQTVNELMYKEGVGWNVEILNQLFNRKEIQAIRNAPISSLGLTDRLIWCDAKMANI